MDISGFKSELFSEAKRQGADAAEVYYRAGEEYSVRVLEGAVDGCDMNRTRGVCLRVQQDGRQGYAYTEVFSGAAALVARALDNAAAAGGEPSPMQPQGLYPEVTPPPDRIGALTPAQRTELARELERAAKSADPRVARMAAAMVFCGRDTVEIDNTEGLSVREEVASGGCYCAPIVIDGSDARNAGAFRIGERADDIAGCAREAVELALAKLGGGSLPTGSYRVIIKNKALAELLCAFAPMFCADMAQKGLSPLAGREGERIASDRLSLFDDALYPLAPRRFDDEGTPAQRTPVIEAGRLQTLLHSAKTAAKAGQGVRSTGNGQKRGTAAPVGVCPTNMYIAAGERSFPELLAELGEGIVIDDLSGLHAGANAVTGQFSLLAAGQYVKDGRLARPVEQITIAGDFLSLLSGIAAVGADLDFALPSGGMFGAPSVLFGGVQVSGEM